MRILGRVSSGCPPVYAALAGDLDSRGSPRHSMSAHAPETIGLQRARGGPIGFAAWVYSTTQNRDSNAPEGRVSADVSANGGLTMKKFSQDAQWRGGSPCAPLRTKQRQTGDQVRI